MLHIRMTTTTGLGLRCQSMIRLPRGMESLTVRVEPGSRLVFGDHDQVIASVPALRWIVAIDGLSIYEHDTQPLIELADGVGCSLARLTPQDWRNGAPVL